MIDAACQAVDRRLGVVIEGSVAVADRILDRLLFPEKLNGLNDKQTQKILSKTC